jgi:hypothetical protein
MPIKARASQKKKTCLVKEGLLCPFFDGNAKGGNVAFEPSMNHLCNPYEPLNPP